MSKFIDFSEEEVYRAAHTEIKSILDAKGEKSNPSGSEWEWDANHSVKFRNHVFYDHATGDKGTAIDFLCLFFKMSFQDAVCTLINKDYNGVEFVRAELKPREKAVFKLPSKAKNMQRIYAYLTKERCLDQDVISFFVHNRSLYESANTHNAIFVGYDSAGKARAAGQRGTLTVGPPFRRDVVGSEKEYFFHYAGGSNRVYVFEAPIDLMSFINLYKEKGWKQHNYVALGGVADKALLRFLLDNPHVTQVVLCLDNDDTGIPAANELKNLLKRISNGLAVEGIEVQMQENLKRDYEVSILKPRKKDWNEDLKTKTKA